jgi:O-antigen ligase
MLASHRSLHKAAVSRSDQHAGELLSSVDHRRGRKPRIHPRPPVETGRGTARTWSRWTLAALGLLFFPAAFLGSLWLVPLGAALAAIAWLFAGAYRSCGRDILVPIAMLLAYWAPSALACWTNSGFCIAWMIEQEVYLLVAGLLLCVCGYAALGLNAGRASVLYGTAFVALVTAAVFVLMTRDDLTAGIRPPLLPLLVERNDLALLVAWIFFLHGLQRGAAERTVTPYLAYLVALAIGGLIALATQSRLVVLISLLGVIVFAPVGRRFRWRWLIVGIVAAGVIAVEHAQLRGLTERVLLASGGPAVATRFLLWGAGWDMFLAAPWFGRGLGGFAELAQAYARPGPGRPDLDPRLISWPHNVFIEVLVEKGVAGLAAFLGLWGLALRNLVRRPPPNLREARRAAGFLFTALVLAGLLDSSTKRLWYLPSLLYLLGVSAAIASASVTSRGAAGSAPAQPLDKGQIAE